MSINTGLIWLLAACGAMAAFSALGRRKRTNEKQVHKANLHEWENEGGNLAPAPAAPADLQATRQA